MSPLSFLQGADGTPSTMRVCVFIITGACACLLLCMGFHIVYSTIHNKVIAWSEMSIFAVGIGGIMTTILINKVNQSKVENQAPPPTP